MSRGVPITKRDAIRLQARRDYMEAQSEANATLRSWIDSGDTSKSDHALFEVWFRQQQAAGRKAANLYRLVSKKGA